MANHERYERDHSHDVHIIHTVFGPGKTPISDYQNALKELYTGREDQSRALVAALMKAETPEAVKEGIA